MQHPTFSAARADQHRDELSRQASQARLARSRRPAGRSQWRAPRWWRPAIRPSGISLSLEAEARR